MKLLGLLGFPLGHSFSPQFFRDLFKKENLKGWDYQLFPIENISAFPALLTENPDLAGLNVTIPYKTSILPFLDELDPEAGSLGAVNTITIEHLPGGTRTKGYNTDVAGFRKAFTPCLKPSHDHALVIGSGGSARAVCHVLKELGIPWSVLSRTPGDPAIHSYNSMLSSPELPPLIINCSPAGMFPETCASPLLPFGLIKPGNLVFDLVYNPVETTLMRKAREQGAETRNGMKMLHIQALLSWKLWNNIK